METPISTPASNKIMSWNYEESDNSLIKSRSINQTKEDRSPMLDITNDSPVVSLVQTPSWSSAKEKQTPGSGAGESLLRGQVRSFLQGVKEETFQASKSSLEETKGPFFHLQNFASSPMALLAPTPTNTPMVSNNSSTHGRTTVFSPPVIIQEQMDMSQVLKDMMKKGRLPQSLKLDFTEKRGMSVDSADCSSGVSYQEMGKSSTDDDGASSVWSIQANASSSISDEDEGEEEGIEEEEEEEKDNGDEKKGDLYDVEEDNGDEKWMDELCEEMGQVNLQVVRKQGKFAGKHTRFVYNSEDEIESCEVVLDGVKFEGKHTRFAYNSEDEIEEGKSVMDT